MPSALRALSDDNIRTALGGSSSFRDAAGHERHRTTGIVGPFDVRLDILLGSRPGQCDDCWTQGQRRRVAIFFDVEQYKVQSKRLVRPLPNPAGANSNLASIRLMTAHGSETTRSRYCGDQRRRVDRAHSTERNWVIDAQ